MKNTGKIFFKWNLLIAVLTMFTACLKQEVNPAGGVPGDYISLLDVRKIYKGSDVILNQRNMAGASKITGVVISDATSGNMPKGTFVMQQTSRSLTRGIEITLGETANINYKIGDSLVLDVDGAKIMRSYGSLQIGIVRESQIVKVAEGRNVSAMDITLETLKANFNTYESTLVKISNVDAVTASSVLSGDVQIKDIATEEFIVHTESTALFATDPVPINASYTGIARLSSNSNGADESEMKIWLRNSKDIEDKSGLLYENFPEDFESGTGNLMASGYGTIKTGNLKAGPYTFTNLVLGNTVNDLAVSGSYALRLVGSSTSDSWCTMNYDLPNGASKVTIWAGSYGASADLGSTWRLQYSQNQGLTWSQVGEDILTISKTKQRFTFLMDIRGPVRFRVGKIGIGTSTINNQNGRLSMDDFAIYANPEGGGPVTNPVPDYESLMSWQFGVPASSGNETVYSSTTTNDHLNTGILSRGNGLNVSTLVRSFAGNAGGTVITSTKAIAIDQDVYYQVTLSSKPGYKLSLSAIDVKLRKSGAGAKNHCWYYSLDGQNFKQTSGTGDVNYEGTETEGLDMPSYYTYQTPELQNIPSGTTVTLRMYCWGFSNIGSGSFSIGRTPIGTTTPALNLNGKMTPE